MLQVIYEGTKPIIVIMLAVLLVHIAIEITKRYNLSVRTETILFLTFLALGMLLILFVL